LNENSKDRTKLMSYVTKLENQNQELNMHIMTLQRGIEQIEEKTTHKVQTNNPQHHDYHTINQNLAPDNNSLLHSIQYRVTSFVLKQIDKQLQQLENNMVTTITEQNTSNTDSKC
jgi:exonuclease VII small subunit